MKVILRCPQRKLYNKIDNTTQKCTTKCTTCCTVTIIEKLILLCVCFVKQVKNNAYFLNSVLESLSAT